MKKTDRLDKMQSHSDALTRAVARDKLAAKLYIQNKPIVTDNHEPKFQLKLRECIHTAERNMIEGEYVQYVQANLFTGLQTWSNLLHLFYYHHW